MAQCQETKKQRTQEKGSGRTITKHVLICGLEAVEGSDYCPRHQFMHKLKEETEQQKDLAAHMNRNVSHRGEGLPQTRAELIRRGYQFVGNKTCTAAACKKPIELWRTPNNRLAPFNPMPEANSHAQSHYATCVRADEFRRAS